MLLLHIWVRMFEIVDKVWLGSFAQAKEFVKEHADHVFVLNCTQDLPMLSDHGMRLPVHDDGSRESSVNMLIALPHLVDTIHATINQGTHVVVHCLAGQQRSPAVVCAYLMKHRGYSLEDAIHFLRHKKKDAFFWQVNFREALERFAIILGKPPVTLR